MTRNDVIRIYLGSDGDATRALYAELAKLGPVGTIAINLFRAVKTSERAKKYRGGNTLGRYRTQAYARKQWSIENLCAVLFDHGAALGITWGWGVDPEQKVHRHVLYVELPTGQVSFHSAKRGLGPDYPRGWDGVGGSADRIVRWVGQLVEGEAVSAAA